MTVEQTIAVLGQPILSTTGRGFELWTYDNGAEVLLFGSLIGWSAPGHGDVFARSMDVWRAHRAESYLPTFLTLLPRSQAKPPVAPVAAGSGGGRTDGMWLPAFVGRRR